MKHLNVNIILIACLFSTNGIASTVTYNMNILATSADSEFASLSPSRGGTSIYPGSADLDGIPQFDSLLGTLNKATFIFSGNFSYSLSNDFSSDPFFNTVIDETTSNSMSMNSQLGIGLAQGLSSHISSVASPVFSCSAGAFEGACVTNVEDITPTLFSLERSDGSYRFDELTGSGVLSHLRLELFASNDDAGVVNNIENDIVFIDLLFDGEVSVEYDFTPATVPVPAAVWLFGSGLVGLIGMRKKSSKVSELSA